MSGNVPQDLPEESLKRLIVASVAEPEAHFQRKLTAAVLEEVRKQRGRTRADRLRKAGWGLLSVAAVVVAAVIAVWWINVHADRRSDSVARDPESSREPGTTPENGQTVETFQTVDRRQPGQPGQAGQSGRSRHPGQPGQVRRLYGRVCLHNGGSPRQVDAIELVHAGQWVETYSGSEAAILLPDASRLSVRPRTRVQLAEKPDGARLVMESGALRVDAAKQAPGNSLTIETPGAKITVLGTRLDVHVVEKLDGRKQTRVSVLSGKVELESAGREIVLLPNTEGVADEGEPPLARSLTAEVNEMIRLVRQTEVLAAGSDVSAGRPWIVEFNGDGSATIWTILPVPNTTKSDLASYTLPRGMSASVIEAHTLDGAMLPVASWGDARAIDLSMAPVPPGADAAVIVKLADVLGIFEDQGSGTYESSLPATGSGVLSLVQFRLPASARIEDLDPAPIESRQTLSRLVVTVAVDGRLADVVP
jgi:hypothetical protein